jgi:hypothetical protein
MHKGYPNALIRAVKFLSVHTNNAGPTSTAIDEIDRRHTEGVQRLGGGSGSSM